MQNADVSETHSIHCWHELTN